MCTAYKQRCKQTNKHKNEWDANKRTAVCTTLTLAPSIALAGSSRRREAAEMVPKPPARTSPKCRRRVVVVVAAAAFGFVGILGTTATADDGGARAYTDEASIIIVSTASTVGAGATTAAGMPEEEDGRDLIVQAADRFYVCLPQARRSQRSVARRYLLWFLSRAGKVSFSSFLTVVLLRIIVLEAHEMNTKQRPLSCFANCFFDSVASAAHTKILASRTNSSASHQLSCGRTLDRCCYC
jgi:hypothetical protein